MTEEIKGKHRKAKQRDKFFAIRNVLNIIFMVLAVVGVCIYCFTQHTQTGVIIVLTGMAFKMVECGLRMFR